MTKKMEIRRCWTMMPVDTSTRGSQTEEDVEAYQESLTIKLLDDLGSLTRLIEKEKRESSNWILFESETRVRRRSLLTGNSR